MQADRRQTDTANFLHLLLVALRGTFEFYTIAAV